MLEQAEKSGIEVVSVNGGKSANDYQIKNKNSGEVLGEVNKSIFDVNGPNVETLLQQKLQTVLAKNTGAKTEQTAPTLRLADGLTKKDLAEYGLEVNGEGFSVEYHSQVMGPADLEFDPQTDHITISRDRGNINITTYDRPNKDNKIYETVTTIGPNKKATLTSETYRSRAPIEIPHTIQANEPKNRVIDPINDAKLYRSIEQAQRYGYSFEVHEAKGGGSVITVSNSDGVIKGIPFFRQPRPGTDKEALQNFLDDLLSKEK